MSKLIHNVFRAKSIFELILSFKKNSVLRKQLPKRRKIAQSGHPVHYQGHWLTIKQMLEIKHMLDYAKPVDVVPFITKLFLT
jgi:hypothetical protein